MEIAQEILIDHTHGPGTLSRQLMRLAIEASVSISSPSNTTTFLDDGLPCCVSVVARAGGVT